MISINSQKTPIGAEPKSTSTRLPSKEFSGSEVKWKDRSARFRMRGEKFRFNKHRVWRVAVELDKDATFGNLLLSNPSRAFKR